MEKFVTDAKVGAGVRDKRLRDIQASWAQDTLTGMDALERAYEAGAEHQREQDAAKVESMANFTGYYAGYCNDPLLTAAEAIRSQSVEPEGK